MIYFKNKHLSDKLNINLAKWKRWSREFLDPDPLGGLRSGYARQFSYRDAFIVYVGGFLVGTLKLSIPQAKQILSDLTPWLKAQGYFSLPGQKRPPKNDSARIRIFHLSDGKFGFEIRNYFLKGSGISGEIRTEQFRSTLINVLPDNGNIRHATHNWVLLIDNLHQTFLNQISA